MKQQLWKLSVGIIFGFVTLVTSLPVEAYYYYHGRYYRDGYYGQSYRYQRQYYNTYRYNYRCKWVGGYWSRGYYHPARRVCWYR